MYSDRKELSYEDKSTVKDIYKELMQTNETTGAKEIIDKLDSKILKGLKDILVKKIVLLKKEKKYTDLAYVRSIAQIVVDKQNSMITANITSGDIALEVKKIQ